MGEGGRHTQTVAGVYCGRGGRRLTATGISPWASANTSCKSGTASSPLTSQASGRSSRAWTCRAAAAMQTVHNQCRLRSWPEVRGHSGRLLTSEKAQQRHSFDPKATAYFNANDDNSASARPGGFRVSMVTLAPGSTAPLEVSAGWALQTRPWGR